MEIIQTQLQGDDFITTEFYRYKIVIEYLGTYLSGWQRQASALSVQQILEEAIYRFSGERVLVHGAGRTDAGVHALGQVAHFDLVKYIKESKIIGAINHFVRPHMIGVVKCLLVESDFHARFSAYKRYYMYRIINRESTIIVDLNRAWWIKHSLNIESMKQGAAYLIGNHDFTSFRAKSCQAKSALKTVSIIEIIRVGEEIQFHVSAPSFLHHMVRNIVGSLVLVGKNIWKPEEIRDILAAKDREKGGVTAPACGLYFMKVDY